LPPEISFSSPFTWEDEGWPSFDMSGRISELFTAHLAIRNGSASDPLRIAESRVFKVPFNPNAGLAQAITGAGQNLGGDEHRLDGHPHVRQWGVDYGAGEWYLWEWQPQGAAMIYTEPVTT